MFHICTKYYQYICILCDLDNLIVPLVNGILTHRKYMFILRMYMYVCLNIVHRGIAEIYMWSRRVELFHCSNSLYPP